MALKTFNIDAEIYKEFSAHSKKEGYSMSKKIENFIRSEMDNTKSDVKAAIKKIERRYNLTKQAQQPKEHSFMKYC